VSDQKTLFPQMPSIETPRFTRKAHQVLVFTRGPTGCLVCKGSINGVDGPPSEELILKTVSDKGWKVERIEAKGADSTYPFFVHVVCHG